MKRTTTILSIVSAAAFSSVSSATIIYDNIPAALPGNVPSWGYEATSTDEFGNAVSFAGTDRDLTNVRITMSDWAKQVDYPGVGDATGYDHPITVNIYNVGPNPGDVGSLIATQTQTVHVPWHTTVGFNGTAFNVDFDFTGTTVPNSAIFAVAYNTADYGAAPIGAAGPYNSLNYGLIGTAPSVGTDIDADDTELDSSWAGAYTDGGVGGLDFLRQDTNWTGFTPMLQVTAVPEPATMGVIAFGAVALLGRRRRSA